MRLIDADKIQYTSIAHLASYPVAPSPCDTVMRAEINAIPTVDAVPVVHGKWIYSNDFHWYTASCNKCGYQRRTDIKAERWNQWMYCPNCGAKMEAE